MQQTFLNYAATDLRFWSSSMLAIARSVLPPFAVLFAVAATTCGQAAALCVVIGTVLFALLDWCALVVRMARRIALGIETPNDLLDRGVVANAGYLHRAYYAGPMPTLRPARG